MSKEMKIFLETQIEECKKYEKVQQLKFSSHFRRQAFEECLAKLISLEIRDEQGNSEQCRRTV